MSETGDTYMRGQRSQLLIGLALFALLIVFALVQGPREEVAPYDLRSASPNGLRALRLWLQELGYDVGRTSQQDFFVPAGTDLLFVYPGEQPYRAEHAAIVRDWVGQGGTLVMIGATDGDDALTEIFQVEALPAQTFGGSTQQVQPLLPDLDATWGSGAGRQELDLSQTPQAIAVLVRDNGSVTAAVQKLDRGTVWHFTTDHDFANQSLREREQAGLLPAILRTVPEGGNILFDTYHMFAAGEQADNQITSIRDWLYRTYAGWALIFGIGVVLLYLLLEGRRLGPPLPAQTGTQRREAAEFVAAMAGLQRRAHLSEAVARHHKWRLKAELGRTYRISPDLPDPDFVQRLRERRGYLKPEQVRDVAAVLKGFDISTDDKELIQLVNRIDLLLNQAA